MDSFFCTVLNAKHRLSVCLGVSVQHTGETVNTIICR